MSEEDVAKIENLIKKCDKCKLKECINCEISCADVKAIEHLIKAYKELEEKNRKLKEHCKEQIKDKQELTTALLDSIPISLVAEKIEELWIKYPKNSINRFATNERNNKIQVLQELLEKRK